MKFLVAVPREQVVAGGGASLFGSLSVVLMQFSHYFESSQNVNTSLDGCAA
jgi:hypothetical protein